MLINKTSEKKKLKNNILSLASEAAKAKKEDISTINATAGMFKNEDGTLYEFNCVKEVIKQLKINEKFAYGSSAGSPAFKDAVCYSLFGKYLEDIKKEAYIECIPTPGGTGALTLAFTNYVSPNEMY